MIRLEGLAGLRLAADGRLVGLEVGKKKPALGRFWFAANRRCLMATWGWGSALAAPRQCHTGECQRHQAQHGRFGHIGAVDHVVEAQVVDCER